jgi:hypothetical protein
MAIDITKGIEPFEDRMDFSRNNPERKPFASKGTDQVNIGSEYDPFVPPPEVKPPDPPPVTPPPAPKFTHKLANGTTLEAATVEDLAAQIEKAITQQAPAPVVEENFEDKPVYEGYQFSRKELTLQEQANILNVMRENPQKAYRMLQEAETGATTEKLLQVLNETQMALRLQKEMEAGAEFLGECEDFNPTTANSKKITDYLKEQKKPVTLKNLKVAFRKLVAAGDKSLLVKVEEAPPVDDKDLTDTPPPPVVVPSNLGRPEEAARPGVDAAKFAALPLSKQKEYFDGLKRR